MKTIRLLAILEANSLTGPARNLLRFAEYARTAEPPVETLIAVFRRGAGSAHSNPLLEKAAELEVPVFPIAEAGRFDRAVIAQLQTLARKLEPDLIQTHAVKSHLLARLAHLGSFAPWIAFHHGYTWPDLRARAYNQLDRWSLRAADKVLTVSLPFREELVRRGVPRGRIEVIHNAVEPDFGRQWGGPPGLPCLWFLSPQKEKPDQEELARRNVPRGRIESPCLWSSSPQKDKADQEVRPTGAKVILIVGRLSREKDHLTLLEAMRRLRADAVPPAHLVIVGDGPERARIERAIRELGLTGSVTLAGQVPTAEPFYARADVSVLSSLSEGSPNALLESMAAGVPVVATSVGGVPEIVTHAESALLVPPRDAAAMSAAIGRLLADEAAARKLADCAHALVLARHSPKARANRLTDIYSELLEFRADSCEAMWGRHSRLQPPFEASGPAGKWVRGLHSPFHKLGSNRHKSHPR